MSDARATREKLRATFDGDAERYQRARPTYPAQLFDDLALLARLRRGSRILELGCGTGQATIPLARRGYDVVAVELGAALADVARRRARELADVDDSCGAVDVITGSFESWPLPTHDDARFDLVLAATSFHWLDPGVRIAKSAAALRPGGALAIIETHHVAGGTQSFFDETQPLYRRWDPEGMRAAAPLPPLPPEEHVGVDGTLAELRAAGFTDGGEVVRRYAWERRYTSAAYVDVLLTYSGHRALAPDARAGLLGDIARLIDDGYGGAVSKRYLNVLIVARRSSR